MAPTFERQAIYQGESVTPTAFCAGGFDLSMFSTRSPAKSTVNEDAAGYAVTSDETHVLVVADGVGGSPSGEDAARFAVDQILARVEEASGRDTAVREQILRGLDEANLATLSLEVGAASTVVCATIRSGQLRCYHVGDSKAFVIGPQGQIRYETLSHSPTGYLIRAGLLDEDGARCHEGTHVVSNVVGSKLMTIEIGRKFELSARDTVLVATDGLTDNLSTKEIAEIVHKRSVADAALELAERTRARMSDTDASQSDELRKSTHPDDLTFILSRATADNVIR